MMDFKKNYQTKILDHDPIFVLIIDKNVFWSGFIFLNAREISTLISFFSGFWDSKKISVICM